MSWTADVVDTLCALKRDGLDYDLAWELAMQLHPPLGRDMGVWRPTLLGGSEEETVVNAIRRFCDGAWHGRRPSLRQFSAGVMRDAVLDSADAGGSAIMKRRPIAV